LGRSNYGPTRAIEFSLGERRVGEDIRALEVISQQKATNTTTHPGIGFKLVPVGLIKVMI